MNFEQFGEAYSYFRSVEDPTVIDGLWRVDQKEIAGSIEVGKKKNMQIGTLVLRYLRGIPFDKQRAREIIHQNI